VDAERRVGEPGQRSRATSAENGDGFDNRESDGTWLISNTAYGNQNDGFSIEGNVVGITLANNIGANNGVLAGGNNLFVDESSTAGFAADYDVWWNGRGRARQIKFANVLRHRHRVPRRHGPRAARPGPIRSW
jgi:hypothetical protein